MAGRDTDLMDEEHLLQGITNNAFCSYIYSLYSKVLTHVFCSSDVYVNEITIFLYIYIYI